jgi:hypothetical protein
MALMSYPNTVLILNSFKKVETYVSVISKNFLIKVDNISPSGSYFKFVNNKDRFLVKVGWPLEFSLK